MSVVSSELTIAELEGQVGELLPAREEMLQFTFNRKSNIVNLGNRSGTTLGNEQVVFSGRVNTTNFNF